MHAVTDDHDRAVRFQPVIDGAVVQFQTFSRIVSWTMRRLERIRGAARPPALAGRHSARPYDSRQPVLVFAPLRRCAHPQRTRPQRSRQHQLQRRRPQRSRQQFRHLTRSRSLLGPLIALFDSGTMGMADPVVEVVASSSPAKPIASAIFDMRKPPWASAV